MARWSHAVYGIFYGVSTGRTSMGKAPHCQERPGFALCTGQTK